VFDKIKAYKNGASLGHPVFYRELDDLAYGASVAASRKKPGMPPKPCYSV